MNTEAYEALTTALGDSSRERRLDAIEAIAQGISEVLPGAYVGIGSDSGIIIRRSPSLEITLRGHVHDVVKALEMLRDAPPLEKQAAERLELLRAAVLAIGEVVEGLGTSAVRDELDKMAEALEALRAAP